MVETTPTYSGCLRFTEITVISQQFVQIYLSSRARLYGFEVGYLSAFARLFGKMQSNGARCTAEAYQRQEAHYIDMCTSYVDLGIFGSSSICLGDKEVRE